MQRPTLIIATVCTKYASKGRHPTVQKFIKSFLREAPGHWACVEPVTWDGPPRIQVAPGTRFTRGTMFMGMDIAKLLDEQYEEDQRRR